MNTPNDVLGVRVRQLSQLVAASTEGVRLEHQRRVDIASAALTTVKPVWDAIDARRAQHELETIRTRNGNRMFGVAFALGLGLHWWSSGDAQTGFGAGAWLMIGSAVLWVLQLWKLARTQADVSRLQDREADYLYAAMSAGASFYRYRQLMKAKAKVEAESNDTTESAEADFSLHHAWLSIQWELLDRVSGSSTFDWWSPHLSAALGKDADGK